MKVKKIAYLFPGQGAQVVGMGRDFFEASAEAKAVFEEAETFLHRKLTRIIFEGPEQLLTETKNSQIALFVTSMALLATLKKQFPDLFPFVTAGLSLGEYSALQASNRIAFKDACPLVQFRGECMNEACEMNQGAMAAILGLSSEKVEEVVKACQMPDDLWIANYNTPLQTVVSGTEKGIMAAEKAALESGARRFIRLNVHGAFHSGLMRRAQKQLEQPLLDVPLQTSSIGFVMNVIGDFVKDENQVRDLLIRQVTSSVRWSQGILAMEKAGVDLYLEIGAGKVLSGFNRQIGVNAPTLNISTLRDLDQLATTLY